ncbi:MAG: hypothetical protein GYA62_09995 [Bacteroidales bacterium]|mgnify:CR=1 FL=1|nr:hypothetical protein [Bacteroidales bacterium]
MKDDKYSVPIRLVGEVAEKTNELASLLDISIQKIANKVLSSVIDEAINNTKNFLNSFDEKNKKNFIEIYRGTLKDLNKKRSI